MSDRAQWYKVCEHIKRATPDFHIDEEIVKQIGAESRTLPSFEKGIYEKVFIRHYSLDDNELLSCRWKQYKSHLEDRVVAPFQFPNVTDLHFYNHAIRYLPALSIRNRPTFIRTLKPGPGVDHCGQMPIPFELFMKRGNPVKEDPSHCKKEN